MLHSSDEGKVNGLLFFIAEMRIYVQRNVILHPENDISCSTGPLTFKANTRNQFQRTISETILHVICQELLAFSNIAGV